MNANSPGDLLVVDDEAVALRNLAHVLRKEGYTVTARQSGAGALAEIESHRFDAVLTDLRMEQVDGWDVLRRTRERQPEAEVIILTGYATLDSAVAAVKEGAYHFLAKPYRLEEIRQVVRNALDTSRRKQENQLRFGDGSAGRVNIVTQDPDMQRLLETARQIAPTDCNVLITGESGTGKELLARYLHQCSKRARGPFVAVNCGAFQEELLASELFGHEKGAYTGAESRKRGHIEAAEKGTLFLDEIAEMTPTMQVKLLRVLQEREVLRVGSTEPFKVDVRVIAATNRDLQQAVVAGRFRSDLYFRLNVVNLEPPPLRDRRDDAELLVHYFLHRHATAMARPVTEITPAALRLLCDYDYPGNVRELANLVERGVALATGTTIDVPQLPDTLKDLRGRVLPVGEIRWPTLDDYETGYIREVLEHTGGNRVAASRILGIDRVSLWRRIKRAGLE
ncbi:MAG: sigma-54-dependent Fis family transcriptional regulator [Sulfuricella sp.]|nr:sigma-54-dependent Fis family transcriptional regulator [Sulfuricella sp.]